MLHGSAANRAVIEKLIEFDRVAAILDMPEAERLGILNVSHEVYSDLRQGRNVATQSIKPELERRLSYALPLMRRLASNTRARQVPLEPPMPNERSTAASSR